LHTELADFVFFSVAVPTVMSRGRIASPRNDTKVNRCIK
jgi:hypothetical protein